MEASNLYRHVLGITDVGVHKVKGLSDLLQDHYPHISLQYRAERVEAVLEQDAKFICAADAIVIALGDETLELWLNQFFGSQRPRLHAWLDPLGIGGHVLGTGIGGEAGCFRCLFERDEQLGLYNKASFANRGQTFQRSIAGCSGTFAPFAGVDADRTALEAARLVARILTGKETENVLVSWFGYPDEFLEAGFTLSTRAELFQPGDCKRIKDFATRECPHCCG